MRDVAAADGEDLQPRVWRIQREQSVPIRREREWPDLAGLEGDERRHAALCRERSGEQDRSGDADQTLGQS